MGPQVPRGGSTRRFREEVPRGLEEVSCVGAEALGVRTTFYEELFVFYQDLNKKYNFVQRPCFRGGFAIFLGGPTNLAEEVFCPTEVLFWFWSTLPHFGPPIHEEVLGLD